MGGGRELYALEYVSVPGSFENGKSYCFRNARSMS